MTYLKIVMSLRQKSPFSSFRHDGRNYYKKRKCFLVEILFVYIICCQFYDATLIIIEFFFNLAPNRIIVGFFFFQSTPRV